MGLRFRKSINLGGGFRVNISKSGVGYSWGVKGYRITKTAKGTIRKTASIPGTGISYVQESSQKPNKPNKNIINNDSNSYDTQEIENAVASQMVSNGLEEILSAAHKSLLLNKLSNFGLAFFFILGCGFYIAFLAFFLCLILKFYVKTAGTVDLEYTIDPDQKEYIENQMRPMIQVTQSDRVWRIMQSSKVIDRKYTAGATSTVKRLKCKTSQTVPFPFKADITAAVFKCNNETLIFLPDKLFLIQGSRVGALNYSDITTATHTTNFVEEEPVPKDAKIVGETWRYINKSGGPDKRFKNNRKLPICLYGEIELKSTSGLNTIIMFSNIDFNKDSAPAPKSAPKKAFNYTSKDMTHAKVMTVYVEQFHFNAGESTEVCRKLFDRVEPAVTPDTQVVTAFIAEKSGELCACAIAVSKFIVATEQDVLTIPIMDISEFSYTGGTLSVLYRSQVLSLAVKNPQIAEICNSSLADCQAAMRDDHI